MKKSTRRSVASSPGWKTSSARASGASGAGLPLVLQDAHEDCVVEARVPLYGLAVAALHHEPQFLVGREGFAVEIEGAKAHAVQFQFFEGVDQQQFDGLRPVALVAVAGMAHDHGEFRRFV